MVSQVFSSFTRYDSYNFVYYLIFWFGNNYFYIVRLLFCCLTFKNSKSALFSCLNNRFWSELDSLFFRSVQQNEGIKSNISWLDIIPLFSLFSSLTHALIVERLSVLPCNLLCFLIKVFLYCCWLLIFKLKHALFDQVIVWSFFLLQIFIASTSATSSTYDNTAKP